VSLKELIKFLNDEQKIYNAQRFGPVNDDTILITIQVHNRIEYLRHLITSLRVAKDIDKVLLIFSHDIYNTSINELVRSIDFCMVMQIFYPYSIQLYADEFPGTDPRDCDRDIGRAVALRKGCLNARNDDTYITESQNSHK
jgi:alpha-1,6-mannosyl-glycoprotein beta-1,2-N-acetylglucosaminyltransferase